MDRATLYRTIWRWHFYAGLIVVPLILLLSVTGSIYLFKPQIDAWEEGAWRGPPLPAGQVAADPETRLAAALAHVPGASVRNFRLPRDAAAPAAISVDLPNDAGIREIFVDAGGRVTANVDPEQRWSAWIARLHGSLLLGLPGGLIVETAASWAIVMILTGLYLWWPRGRGMAGVIWPRLGRGRQVLWRDLHAVTGFWVSGLAMILLLSGLPWTDGWAAAFRLVRSEMGWVSAMPPDWRGGGATADYHADHDGHEVAAVSTSAGPTGVGLNAIVDLARQEALPYPVIVQPPGAPSRFGPPNGPDWKVTSEAQNRPLIRSFSFDAATGVVTTRSEFADKHVIDRIINYGIAWHEGQLFGWINQLIGVLTGLALFILATTGTILWWRRRPAAGGLAPPPAPAERRRGLILLLAMPALFLPMMALSLIAIVMIDGVLLRAWRRVGAA